MLRRIACAASSCTAAAVAATHPRATTAATAAAAAPCAARRCISLDPNKNRGIPAEHRYATRDMPSDTTIGAVGSTLGNYTPGKKRTTADKEYPLERDVFFGSSMLIVATVLIGASTLRDRYADDEERRQEIAEQVAAAAVLRACGGAPDAKTYGVQKSSWRDDDVVVDAAIQEVAAELALALAAIVAPTIVAALAAVDTGTVGSVVVDKVTDDLDVAAVEAASNRLASENDGGDEADSADPSSAAAAGEMELAPPAMEAASEIDADVPRESPTPQSSSEDCAAAATAATAADANDGKSTTS